MDTGKAADGIGKGDGKATNCWPIVIMLVMLPMLYVASIGPAQLLRRDQLIPEGGVVYRAWPWFYAPLNLALHQSATCRRGVTWWVSLWIGQRRTREAGDRSGFTQQHTTPSLPQIAC